MFAGSPPNKSHDAFSASENLPAFDKEREVCDHSPQNQKKVTQCDFQLKLNTGVFGQDGQILVFTNLSLFLR